MSEFNQSTQGELFQSPTMGSMSLDILSSQILRLINNTFISTIIGLLGMVANVINMIVFVHQGLNSSINISLFFMAISDIVTVILVEWANICFNPYIDNLGAPISFAEVYYMTGGWPSGLAYRITLYITVYITAERCLCILFPLTIKSIITPRRTKLIIAVIYIVNGLTLVPEYSSVYLSWRFNQERNETILGVAFSNNRLETQGISFLLHVILVVFGLCCVIMLTSVLVIYLRRQAKWRLKNSGESKLRASLSSRDRKSTALVTVVATSVVIFYIPLTCVSLATVFVPEFYVEGKLFSAFRDTWAMIMIFGMTNASSNIFIYYKMNSKFKSSFIELFCNRLLIKK